MTPLSCVPTSQAHKDELKKDLITSTDALVLVGGKCRWRTFKGLLQEKVTRTILPVEVNDFMRKGLEFEPIVAKRVAVWRGWNVAPDPKFYWIPDLRIGTSVDWRFTDLDALDEVKTVWDYWAWKKGWGISNGQVYRATPYVEWQLQHQMLVTGTRVIWLSVRGPSGDLAWGKREANSGMHRIILDNAKDLWREVDRERKKTLSLVA